MESQVSNGTGLQEERITNLLLFGFLQNYSNSSFHHELLKLQPQSSKDDELLKLQPQSSKDDELQTDGNLSSHLSQEELADSESQEEVIRDIARNLAQIGDSLDGRIQPALVNHLAAQFRNPNLSEEERRKSLASVLDQVMQSFPNDMEKEKMMLTLTMLLAKKVAEHTPSLLREVFRTTVNLINQNLLPYVRNLVRNEMD